MPTHSKSSIIPYITGFIFSLILTLSSYTLVMMHITSKHETPGHDFVLYSISILAAVQLVVQGIFFLHLGKNAKRSWNLLFFISTISIILVVVIGAIWIMKHLNYNMTPRVMERAIIKDEGMHMDK